MFGSVHGYRNVPFPERIKAASQDRKRCLARQVRLSRYPFGEKPVVKSPQESDDQPIILVADPGSTDLSVAGMVSELRRLQGRGVFHPGVTRFRTIRVAVGRNGEDRSQNIHSVYFEVVSPLGICIAGGCNDYTATPMRGSYELEACFRGLCRMFNLEIEEVLIAEPGDLSIPNMLLCAYYEHKAH